MEQFVDYYAVLGVPPTASQEEIQAAFRKQARQFHPDVNPEGEEKFKALAKALSVLKDPEQRKLYDLHREMVLNGGIASNFFPDGTFVTFSVVEKQAVLVPITLEEAIEGCTKSVSVRKLLTCSECQGLGFKRGEICPVCGGSPFSPFICPRCHGRGTVAGPPCTTCAGRGIIESPFTIEVQIKPGANPVDVTFVQEPNVTYAVRVIPQIVLPPGYSIEGDLLCKEEAVDPVYMVIGGEINVSVPLAAPAKLKIPPGTMSGQVLMVPGCGLPQGKSGRRAPLLVRIIATPPTDLSETEKNLLSQYLAEREGKSLTGPK